MRCSGHKASLGLCIEQTEGATFWLKVMNALKQRGTQDIRVAVVAGLKGFPEALETVFPATVVQTTYVVHLIGYLWPGRHGVVENATLKRLYADALRDNHALREVNSKWCRLWRDA